MRYEVWRRVFMVVTAIMALQGASWAVLGSFDPWGLWDRFAAHALFGGETPESVVLFRRFILGPFGATDAGFFVLMWFLGREPLARRELWAWNAAVWAVALWFVIDTAASIARGGLFNVLFVNIPALLLLSIPLSGLRLAIDDIKPEGPGRT